MSAIRSSTNRAEARKKNALPYARSSVKNFFLRVLGFANDDDGDSGIPVSVQQTDQVTPNGQISGSNSRNHDDNFLGSSQQSSFSSRRPLSQVDFVNMSPMGARDPPPSFSAFPPPSLVGNSRHKAAASIDSNTESVSSDSAAIPEKREGFHFIFTAPPPQASSSSESAPSTPSNKKLKRNPNGVYRWDGGGSAKHARPRNRHASPAFGASISKPDRLVMKDDAPGDTDHKRRKTNESGSSAFESPSSSLPFPLTASPSVTPVSGTPARPVAPSAAARLRTPAKPTAPVIPSPLRQAWSDGPSPSSRDDSKKSPSQQAKATKTASFMADLIKEKTPPKKPDLSNPYQTASPVAKVGPPRRNTRRTRATGRPAAPSKEDKVAEVTQSEKEKVEAYSSQAIIEATVPKGSKRSRPPATFAKSDVGEDLSSGNTQREYAVEEPEDDGSERVSKKSKPSLNGNGRPSSSNAKSPPPAANDITIEEIDDVPMRNTDAEDGKNISNGKDAKGGIAAVANASGSTSRASFSGLKSIPKEPSKLRFSFGAEPPRPPSPAITHLPSPRSSPPVLPEPPKFEFTFKTTDKAPVSEPVGLEERPPTEEEVKTQVKAMDVDSLPSYSFTITAAAISSSGDHRRVRDDVKVQPPSSLPTFTFSAPVVDTSTGFKFSTSVTPPSVTPFNFAAAGMKMEIKKDVWTCFCGVVNQNSAAQCIACESPSPSSTTKMSETKPTVPAVPPVKAFDFAGAGFKKPTANKDTWTCSECTLANPNSTSTCGPCGAEKKPVSDAPAVKGFDFAAAGFKMPTAKKDTWTCPECTLTNPNSTLTCGPCGAERKTVAAAPVVKAFDFAAAGFKMPTVSKDTWTCSECTLSNPNSATQCGPCGADRK